MKAVKTDDGSFSFYSDVYGETYHSRNGALRESFEKYCRPCGIKALARGGAISILDVGFGLGYNVLAALYSAKDANSDCQINVISLEKDLIDFKVLNKIEVPSRYRGLYRIVLQALKEKRYFSDGINIRILCGDAREEVKKVDECFDAVFLDPFSVKKNPQLWTVHFFKTLYKRMKEDAMLATYSVSTPVRAGLVEAGFHIGEGPGDKMKRGGTVASKKADHLFMNSRNLEKLKNSPERIPFYDPPLNFTAREIFSYREKLKEK
ncbi:MAG: tRNA (5-methylaminomethyl-2-thiouridine)(34)-methyltransferase MnmD [Deltaproteobacteria bacterium]|nr:tRNA (5-methylaminomethyl-2-thiouridine)(34)-methyltransferase MnmD [Deltaproteobacteria bacterium]